MKPQNSSQPNPAGTVSPVEHQVYWFPVPEQIIKLQYSQRREQSRALRLEPTPSCADTECYQ